MAFLGGIASGDGGYSGETSQAGSTGNQDVKAATGPKNVMIGGNPNVQAAITSPWIWVVLSIGLLVWLKARKRS